MPKCPYGKKKRIPAGCRSCGAFDPDQNECMKNPSYTVKVIKSDGAAMTELPKEKYEGE